MDVLRGVQSETNRLAVADHAFIAELESQGTAREHACHNTSTKLTQLLSIHPGEAAGRVKAAAAMGPRRGSTGEQLPPVFERVAAAQASGAVCAGHAREITKTITGLTDSVRDANEWVEQSLVEAAHKYNPRPTRRRRPAAGLPPGPGRQATQRRRTTPPSRSTHPPPRQRRHPTHGRTDRPVRRSLAERPGLVGQTEASRGRHRRSPHGRAADARRPAGRPVTRPAFGEAPGLRRRGHNDPVPDDPRAVSERCGSGRHRARQARCRPRSP
ncbi:MAG: hypothetical protein DLM59_13345 [Pseudonocardiales bacterium]|nr:MAG: hypothetical protein DLM59_13345 [Pseudonocardiales bacterium]